MRQAIFNLLLTAIQGMAKFKLANGVSTVYAYGVGSPDGYPYATITAESMDSEVLDNYRDLRLYNYLITVVGEKFGEPGGYTQERAWESMRETEDALCSLWDGNNTFSGSGLGIIRTMPTNSKYGYTDGGSRIVLELRVQFQVAVSITTL